MANARYATRVHNIFNNTIAKRPRLKDQSACIAGSVSLWRFSPESMKHMTSTRTPQRILSQGIAALLLAAPFVTSSAYGQAIGVSGTFTYTQTFDSIGIASPAWVDGNQPTPTLAGWYAGINANGTADGNIQASAGATALSGLLNLGTVSAVDRAIGSRVTGTGAFANIGYGVLFQNTSGGTLTVGNISFAGELWRSGDNATATERWDTFYKVSSTLFTDVEPGVNNVTADSGGSTFTALDALDWVSPTSAINLALNGNAAANRSVVSISNAGVTLAAGDYFMLRWIDPNGAQSDGQQGIDDLSITFIVPPPPPVRVYNRSHTVGGAPNGTLTVSAAQYWLDGVTPIGMPAGANATFSQAGDANIDVPVDVATAIVTVSHASGTYTIGGAGRMSGVFIKSNFGTAVLTSANAFNSATLSGGGTSKVVTQHLSALGTAGLTVSSGGGTLQTDVNLTLGGGISGTAPLIKTGPGVLSIVGTGSGSGGITVNAGTLSANSDAAIGGNSQAVTLNGTTIQFTNAAVATYSDATKARLLNIGTGGATISVTDTVQANGIVFSRANSIVGSQPITKTGPGVLRISAAQGTLSSNWTIEQGALEAQVAPTAFGSGSITVKTGGILVVQGDTQLTIANPVTLDGGALGTRSGDMAVFGGPVTVASDSGISLRSNTTQTQAQGLTISGLLSGSSDLNITGTATLNPLEIFTLKNASNTFSGTFNVTAAQTLRSEPGAPNFRGSTLGTATVVLSDAVLELRDNGTGNNGVLNYTSNDLIVETGLGTIDVNRVNGVTTGNVFSLGSLTLGAQTFSVTGGSLYGLRLGDVSLTGSATLNIVANTTIAGVISGSQDIIKTGSGVLILDAINSFLGPTTADQGTLVVNGSLSASNDVAMTGTSTLRGTGTISGSVTLGDTAALAPGPAAGGAGTISTGTISIDPTARLTIELGGTSTSAYDRVVVSGAINLTDPTLTGSLINGFNPQLNDLFFIILNDDTEDIFGTFNGLAQGGVMTFTGGRQFFISYTGDSVLGTFTGGNDVVLKAIPEPGVFVSLIGGLASLVGLQRFRRRS